MTAEVYRTGIPGVKRANRAAQNLTGEPIVAPARILPKGGRVEWSLMGPKARQEYTVEVRRRYRRASRSEKGRLLDEFVAVTGYHRKYAIALLRSPDPDVESGSPRRGRPSRFDAATVDVLVAVWRAADYPWSRRLIALLPLWLPYASTTLSVSPEIASRLLGMSARSADRLLRPHRIALRRRIYGRTKPGTLLKHQVPIRSERWDVSEPGWCETDTVAHCGDSGDGEFACSVNVTDVASTWTETRVVLGKGMRFVVSSLDEIRATLPFRLLGIDSDSGGEFINKHCVEWCAKNEVGFTRGRPYHKNDNAHIEQKNWTHVRKIFGWKRIDAPEAIEAMNELYRNELRSYLNFFQPSVKLIERHRVGSRVRRVYDAPKTPFERLIALGTLAPEKTAELTAERSRLNPFELSAAIEAKVMAILAVPHATNIRKQPKRPPDMDSPLSPRGAARTAAFENALVRSRAAR